MKSLYRIERQVYESNWTSYQSWKTCSGLVRLTYEDAYFQLTCQRKMWPRGEFRMVKEK